VCARPEEVCFFFQVVFPADYLITVLPNSRGQFAITTVTAPITKSSLHLPLFAKALHLFDQKTASLHHLHHLARRAVITTTITITITSTVF
jgi:hypothetical protein